MALAGGKRLTYGEAQEMAEDAVEGWLIDMKEDL
jgi:hypothetical protein